MFRKVLLLFLLFIVVQITIAQNIVELKPGLVIRQSATVKAAAYWLPSANLQTPVIIIEGNNITVDFNEATLHGKLDGQMPNKFTGVGILIQNGKNITVKNLRAHGFQVALLAQNVDSLQILDSDFSYNYRMKLYSIRERENFQDWLSYHQNEQDEWLRYGAGIYLKNCNHALVRQVHITQTQNALLMTNCNDGLFYNNIFNFNSGLGIGMYRSSRNRVMHNVLDFNVRGYSHGFYNRGQDSAGILVYEQSNDNIFAYNSATHSGDGFFLWAGQHTMDTGEGGCNGNLLYANDFSYAPTNGIEVTFSSNTMIKNRLVGCRYGIWGGYSWQSLIADNYIADNDYGIAIEHGQDNTIADNYFKNNKLGIQLWARPTQPADWGYAQKRDVSSRDYKIERNGFVENETPLSIAASNNVLINESNWFKGFKALLITPQPNTDLFFVQNDVYQDTGWQEAERFRSNNRALPSTEYPWPTLAKKKFPADVSAPYSWPAPLPDAQPMPPSYKKPQSRAYIRVNEWGPYNYAYPEIWLDSIKNDLYYFSLLGTPGNWQATTVQGLKLLPQKQPQVLIGQRLSNADWLSLELQYIGEAFINQLGDTVTAGQLTTIRWSRYERKFDWEVRWFAYDEAANPIQHYDAFQKLLRQKPLYTERSKELAYVWWRQPAEGVPADRFATLAKTVFEIPAGRYKIILTSDDGVKMRLDSQLLIDRWNVHESTVDEVEVTLGGRHTIEIEHFDAGGFANLDFRIEPSQGK